MVSNLSKVFKIKESIDDGTFSGAITAIHSFRESIRMALEDLNDTFHDYQSGYVRKLKAFSRSLVTGDYGKLDMAFYGIKIIERKLLPELVSVVKKFKELVNGTEEPSLELKIAVDTFMIGLVASL